MKRLLVPVILAFAGTLLAVPQKKPAKPVLKSSIDTKIYHVADIKDCRVKEGSALYFGIDENEKPDFNTYKNLNKIFNSYTDYLLFIIVEQNLKNSIEELGKQATQNKNIHSELKLLKNEN